MYKCERFAETLRHYLITMRETVSFLRMYPRLSEQSREMSVKLRSRARLYNMTVNYKNWATARTRTRYTFFFSQVTIRAIIANADVCSRFAGPWPVFLSAVRDLNSRHAQRATWPIGIRTSSLEDKEGCTYYSV